MISFDVYDTLITRTVYEPKGIWDLMSQALIMNCETWGLEYSFAMDFSHIRSDAEMQARKNQVNEVTIYDIYEVISNNYVLTEENVDKLIELEIEFEINNTLPIQDNIKKLNEYRENGEKVVLISDMYLPRDFFYSLFEKVCPMLNEIELFLSCEIKKTKSSGKLYEYISKSKGIEYSEWIHMGDNIVSDVNIPRLFGINAIHYQKKVSNNSLQRIQSIANNSDISLKQLLMGSTNILLGEEDTSYYIGFSFIGISLFAYVEWIITQALKRNIKRLFFIARDGYILKQIADLIILENRLNILTSYIYGSRKAWKVSRTEDIELLKQYIYQEIGNDFSDMAFVETQGTGGTMETLSQILNHKFITFYYALFESVNNRNFYPVCYSNGVGGDIIEVLCRAPHGATIGYNKQVNNIVPLLNKCGNEAYDDIGFKKYVKGILDFSRYFIKKRQEIRCINLKNISNDILDYCMNNPDKEIADFLGNMPFDSENGEENKLYAPKLLRSDIYNIEKNRGIRSLETVYKGSNLKMSYARLGDEDKEYLNQCRKEFEQCICEKDESAIRIVIYGFGKNGKELYARTKMNSHIIISDIVDVNYQNMITELVEVNSIEKILESDYDNIVISLNDEIKAIEVKEMLIAAGVVESKIIKLNEFEQIIETIIRKG